MSGFCACETEGYPKLCDAQLDQLCSWTCKEYEQGKRPPLYPVPALPLDVDWWPDPMVTISTTFPVAQRMLDEGRYWKEVWRS